jgi:hypothetical protein
LAWLLLLMLSLINYIIVNITYLRIYTLICTEPAILIFAGLDLLM